MTRQIEDQMVAERLLATLATGFGLISALLASIGLYGVLSFVAWARTREIGLRMALGASRPSILWLIARQTSVLIFAGLTAGVILSVTLARQVQSRLFGIEAIDAVTLVSAVALVLAVTILATLLPARRAARVDPMTALH